jgi:integrase/recombinase XerD
MLHSCSELCKRENLQYYYSREAMIYLRWDEALRVERAAETLRDRLIVRLGMYVGMRAHEIADARIEHVDLINELIYIPHGHLAGPRYAAVDFETLRLLVMYVGSRRRGPLLTRSNGEPITREIVYYAVKKAGEKAGVVRSRPIGPLILRHTFATTWLRRKGNIHLLQRQLGHQQLKSTAYYLDFLPDEVKAEHARLFEPARAVQRWRERVE